MQPDASNPGFSARFRKALMPAEITTLQLKQKHNPNHHRRARTLGFSISYLKPKCHTHLVYVHT